VYLLGDGEKKLRATQYSCFRQEMRRERKKLLRTNLINDIVARWQDDTLMEQMYVTKMKDFEEETEASDAEMLQVKTMIEEQCIQYAQRGLETAQSLKNPSLQTLCRHLYELQNRPWEACCVLSRLDEFSTILQTWRKHYVDTIVATVVLTYRALWERGSTIDDLYERVEYHDDVYHVIPSSVPGHEDILKTWPSIDNRLYAFIDTLNAEHERTRQPRNMSIVGGVKLAAFVKDKQNVHTRIISKQMNDTMNILFTTPVPAEQKTFIEIRAAWERLNLGATLDGRKLTRAVVLTDVQEWGNKSLICKEGDYLYRRLLQHLWARIKTFDTEQSDELVRRLFEECFDALRMCTQGHLSRLTNVLVGFDTNVRGGVSLQDKMAEIARQETTEEEKRAAALVVLNEYVVPEGEHSAWLDAF